MKSTVGPGPSQADIPTAKGSCPGKQLEDVKVADFSAVMAGPYCTRMLADLGAQVIKVEPPGGEHTRSVMPHRKGESAYYGMLNAGKRSVCLDLRTPGGKEAAEALVAWSDVVVENYRPGVMARFGLDYPTIARRDPRLVYCSISGYGQDGPWRDRPATAQVIHATSGYDLALMAHQPGSSRPGATGLFVADALAGSFAVSGILAALHARTHTGLGRYVDVSLLDGLLSMMVGDVQAEQFPDGYHRKSYPPLITKDGFVMVAVVTQRHFEAMARVIGRSELLRDPRFITNSDRWRHATQLQEILEHWTSTQTAAECEEQMLAAGVPATRYRTVGEQLGLEALQRRGTFVTAEDQAGQFQVVGLPFQTRLPDGSREQRTKAPTLQVAPCGADTRAVLADLLGLLRADELLAAGDARGVEP